MRLAFLAPLKDEIEARKVALETRYGCVSPEEADVIVPLGGDGFMLHTLHTPSHLHKRFFGMNCGSVGFLMNNYREDALLERIATAEDVILSSLEMRVETLDGQKLHAFAVNEVYLFRETHQAAKLRVTINDHVVLNELISDGILFATPAGSTAYNLSLGGPILPLGSGLLALTPISAFRPRHWRGALIPDTAEIIIDVLHPEDRPVSAVADYTEFRDVKRVAVKLSSTYLFHLLFDAERSLDKRIFAEQFL